MTKALADVADRLLEQLGEAWNNADGEAFGVPFAEDAEFVTIRGEHHCGRVAIAGGHQAIFDSIYKGQHRQLRGARDQAACRPRGVLAQSTLNAPSGPLAGRHEARFSMVLSRGGGDWQIAAFHNTLVAPPPQA